MSISTHTLISPPAPVSLDFSGSSEIPCSYVDEAGVKTDVTVVPIKIGGITWEYITGTLKGRESSHVRIDRKKGVITLSDRSIFD